MELLNGFNLQAALQGSVFDDKGKQLCFVLPFVWNLNCVP